jgi:Fe-S-cluster containining protein
VPAPDDCQRCGLCCFSPGTAYIRVTGEDWSRLGAAADRWAHFVGHRAYMRMSGGHCAALRRDVKAAGLVSFACAIYPLRPQTCRELERGSPQCEAECLRKRPVARTPDCSEPPAP